MAEAHQARMQTVVEEMVQSLERDHIRKMQVGAGEVCLRCGSLQQQHRVSPVCSSLQGRMFGCSAECCSRPSDSMSQVHQCIERCHTPLAKAQGLVTSELEKFQVRRACARCDHTGQHPFIFSYNQCVQFNLLFVYVNKSVISV